MYIIYIDTRQKMTETLEEALEIAKKGLQDKLPVTILPA